MRKTVFSPDRLLLALILFAVSSCSPESKAPVDPNLPNDADPNPISVDLISLVEYLSSPELQGRLPGSEGYNKAAQFMADQFLRLGLVPGGEDGYFQHFNVECNEINGPCHFNLIRNGSIEKEFDLGEDYVYLSFTGSGHITAPVAFVGYGLSQPESGYDDYGDIDVEGKIVVAFFSRPSWEINGQRLPYKSREAKAIIAADHGALGILFVMRPSASRPIYSILWHDPTVEYDVNFPQLFIEQDVAADLFRSSPYTLADLQQTIDRDRTPFSVDLGSSIEIEVHADYQDQRETKNVIAVLEGSDEELADEYVVIGAHLDHLGHYGDEVFFAGANDNASSQEDMVSQCSIRLSS